METSYGKEQCEHGQLKRQCDICYLVMEVKCAHKLLRRCHRALMNNEQEDFVCLAQEIELDIDVEEQSDNG